MNLELLTQVTVIDDKKFFFIPLPVLLTVTVKIRQIGINREGEKRMLQHKSGDNLRKTKKS